MISAYKIGIEIALTGNISKIISDLTRQFDSVNSAVQRIQASLANLQPGMEKLGRSARETAQAWKEAAAAMERASKATPPGGGGAGGGGGASSALRLGAAGAAIGMIGGSGGSGGGGGGGGYNGPLRIAGPGGGGGGRGGGAGMPALGLGAGAALNSHSYAMAAVGFGALGGGIFAGERKAIDAAGEISHLRAVLIGQGVSPGAADEAIGRAREIARATPGITISQALESAVDLKSVLGGTSWNPASMAPAMTALPAFARTMSLLNAVGKQRGDPTFAAAKAQELLGHLVDEKTGGVSSEELQKHLDATGQVALATNNRVGPTDYLAFVKQARLAGILSNDEFLYRDAPALMMEMGGSRAGTGLAAFSRQFMAGTMTKQKFGELKKLGLFDMQSTWKGGHVAEASQHLKGEELAVSNPAEWVWKVLIPALDKAGIHGRLEQAKHVAQFASTAVGGGFLASLITQEAGIKKESANIGAAQKGGDALSTMYNQDFTLKVKDFEAAFHNLMVDLGGPMMKDATEVLRLATVGMNALGEWAHNNPELAHRLEELATALALFAVGTAAYSGLMFMAGPMIKVATGIATFAAAMPGASAVGGVLLILSRMTGVMTFLAGMKPSTTNAGEDEFLRKHKEMSPDQLRESMDPKNWVPPTAKDGTGKRSGDVYLDGKKVGMIINGHMANSLSGPPTGRSGADMRVSPLMPGMSSAFG